VEIVFASALGAKHDIHDSYLTRYLNAIYQPLFTDSEEPCLNSFSRKSVIRDHRPGLQSIIQFSQKRVRINRDLMGEFGHAAKTRGLFDFTFTGVVF